MNRTITYNNFFNSYEDYYKKKGNLKLKADLLFVLGNLYKKKFSKYIDSEIISIGSFKNNFYNEINESDKNIFFSFLELTQEKIMNIQSGIRMK